MKRRRRSTINESKETKKECDKYLKDNDYNNGIENDTMDHDFECVTWTDMGNEYRQIEIHRELMDTDNDYNNGIENDTMDHDFECVTWTSVWSSENAIASLRLVCAVHGTRLRVRGRPHERRITNVRVWTRVVHGPRIPETEPESLDGDWVDSHLRPRPVHPTHAAWPDIQHDRRGDDDIEHLQPNGERETAWTENDDFGSDYERAAEICRRSSDHPATTSSTTPWTTTSTTATTP